MPGSGTASHQVALIVEMLVLFVALPLSFRFKLVPIPPVPALSVLAAYCLYQLAADRGFDRRALWNAEGLPASALQILVVFAGCALVVAAGVYFLAPRLLFNFVVRAPAFWALVMLLYPVLSVYPQGIIHRAFFLERYRGLFPGPAMLIVVSAAAFSFAHIIFRNPIAVGLR